jgi:hypothetical protein
MIAKAIESVCGDLADFVQLAWDGLNLLPRLTPKPPAKELTLYRGVELPKEALEEYTKKIGQFICWSSFTSVTTKRSVAEGFAGPRRGGLAVIFELRSVGRPRIQGVSVLPGEEELLLHPFSPLRVEAVDGTVVKLVEAELVRDVGSTTCYDIPGSAAKAEWGEVVLTDGTSRVLEAFSGEWTKAISESQLGDAKLVKSVVFPSGVAAVGESALYQFEALELVVLPAGCIDFGKAAFEGCKALKAISFPVGCKATGDSAFAECASLVGAQIPAGCTTIGVRLF